MKYLFYGENISDLRELNEHNNIILLNSTYKELSDYLTNINYANVNICNSKLNNIKNKNNILKNIKYKNKKEEKYIPIGCAVLYENQIYAPNRLIDQDVSKTMNTKWAIQAIQELANKNNQFDIIICPIFGNEKHIIAGFKTKNLVKDLSNDTNFYDIGIVHTKHQPAIYNNLEFFDDTCQPTTSIEPIKRSTRQQININYILQQSLNDAIYELIDRSSDSEYTEGPEGPEGPEGSEDSDESFTDNERRN